VFANLFEHGQLKAGERLLRHGATSGIGVMAIQMAKAAGAQVLATARAADKAGQARALGGGGVPTAAPSAFAFHFAIDDRIQSRIRSWFRARGGRRGQAGLEAGPVISIEG